MQQNFFPACAVKHQVIKLVRDDTLLSFEEYFWQSVDLDRKVILDAGAGFGIITSEIARRIYLQKLKSSIISVDIDPQSFKLARKRLLEKSLLDLVTFVKVDLSHMPQIQTESVDIIISTRTISDINSSPCRLTRAIAEFYRILKKGGQSILSDECPLLKAVHEDEKVAVVRWQLAKAISHLIGRQHSNEVEPGDLEFTMKLVGFQECKWAIFKGEQISQKRIKHFVQAATEMAARIDDSNLKNAFLEGIENVRKIFNKEGGIFPSRYILHATK